MPCEHLAKNRLATSIYENAILLARAMLNRQRRVAIGSRSINTQGMLKMTKTEFLANVKTANTQIAALLAAACGVPFAQVQIWIRSA